MSDILPIVVMPLHDPQGFIFRHLQAVEPVLKQLFSQAHLGVTPVTSLHQSTHLERLESDPFYSLYLAPEKKVGEQFACLFRRAASLCQPNQILHLCFLDRLAFILQSGHRQAFIRDVKDLSPVDTPLLFVRSESAWASHPQNYKEIEQFSTRVGHFLYGRSLDFAWCHLAVKASILHEALLQVRNTDLSMLAEITLVLMESLRVKAVDWLEWEDPFLLGREKAGLKEEREKSRAETARRLSYILPTLNMLLRFHESCNGQQG